MIFNLIEEADWSELYKKIEDEDEYFKDEYVNYFNDVDKEFKVVLALFKTVDNFPNKYLELFMDKPGIRNNQFENYIIRD